MKKWVAYLLSVLLLLGGCMNKTVSDVFVTPVRPDTATTSFLYTPGTYTGTAQGYNGPIEVSITVNEAHIIAVDIVRNPEENYVLEREILIPVTDEDPSKTDELPVGENQEENQSGGKYRTEIEYVDVEVIGRMDTAVNEILANQTTNLDMDLYTGATVSVRGLLEAINNAALEASLR